MGRPSEMSETTNLWEISVFNLQYVAMSLLTRGIDPGDSEAESRKHIKVDRSNITCLELTTCTQ